MAKRNNVLPMVLSKMLNALIIKVLCHKDNLFGDSLVNLYQKHHFFYIRKQLRVKVVNRA